MKDIRNNQPDEEKNELSKPIMDDIVPQEREKAPEMRSMKEDTEDSPTEDTVSSTPGVLPSSATADSSPTPGVSPASATADSSTSDGETGSNLFFSYLLKSAVLVAAFLTPLFYFFSSDVIGISKSLLISTLALTALIGWVGKVITQGELQYRKSWLVWPALATGLLVLVSNFASPAFWPSFLGDTGRSAFNTISFLSYIVIFLTALENLKRKDVLWVVLATIISSVLTSVVALLQFFGLFVMPGEFTNSRTFNTLGSPFTLALFAGFSLPLLIEFFSKVKKLGLKILITVLILLQLFIILIINFGTAWLILAIAMLAYLAFVIFKQGLFSSDWRAQKRITIPLVILVIAVLLWVLPSVPGPRVSDLPAEVSPSYGASLDVVKESWQDNVLLGSGPETFTYVYSQTKSETLNQTNFWGVNFNDANAEIITWATQFGLLGTLAWLFFVLGFLWTSFKVIKIKEEAYFGIGLLASWFFILASKFFYQTPLSLEMFFWILPALFLVWSKSELKSFKFRSGSILTLIAFVVSVFVLIVGIGGLFLTAQRWIAEYSYAKAITTEATVESIDDITNSLQRSVNLNSKEARYHRAFAGALVSKVNVIASEINQRQQAQAGSGQATSTGSGQAGPTQEESVRIQNLTIQAVNSLREARKLDPQNISLLTDIAETYRSMSGYVSGAQDMAVDIYKKAIELEKINPFLRTQLAQIYLAQENFFTDRFVRDTEDIKLAEEELREAIRLNPNYSNARYFLGFILDRQFKRQEALEQFERILAVNPNNEVISQMVANLRAGYPALGQGTDVENPPFNEDEAQGGVSQ